MRTPVPARLRSLAASLVVAGGLGAAGGATASGTVPGIPDPRVLGPAAAGRKGFSPNAVGPGADFAKSNIIINSVAATSATDAWAVGETASSTGVTQLIEHWDGSTWRMVGNPPSGNFRDLFSVTAISATNASCSRSPRPRPPMPGRSASPMTPPGYPSR